MTSMTFADKLGGISCTPNKLTAADAVTPEINAYFELHRPFANAKVVLDEIGRLPHSLSADTEWKELAAHVIVADVAGILDKLEAAWLSLANPDIYKDFNRQTIANLSSVACNRLRTLLSDHLSPAKSRESHLGMAPDNSVTLRLAALHARTVGMLICWQWFQKKRPHAALWQDLVKDYAVEVQFSNEAVSEKLTPGSAGCELARCLLLQMTCPLGLSSLHLIQTDTDIRYFAPLVRAHDKILGGNTGILVNLRNHSTTPLNAKSSREWLGANARDLRYFETSECIRVADKILNLPANLFPHGSRSNTLPSVRNALASAGAIKRTESEARPDALAASEVIIGLHNVRRILNAHCTSTLRLISSGPAAQPRGHKVSLINVSIGGCRITIWEPSSGEINPGQLVWVRCETLGFSRLGSIAWIERAERGNDGVLVTLGIRYLAGKPTIMTFSSPVQWSSRCRVERFVALTQIDNSNSLVIVTPPNEGLGKHEIMIMDTLQAATIESTIERGTDHDLVKVAY